MLLSPLLLFAFEFKATVHGDLWFLLSSLPNASIDVGHAPLARVTGEGAILVVEAVGIDFRSGLAKRLDL